MINGDGGCAVELTAIIGLGIDGCLAVFFIRQMKWVNSVVSMP